MNKLGTVVITGAVRGIGRAVATCLAERAETLILTYNNNNEAVRSIKRDLEDKPAKCNFHKLDLSDTASRQMFVDELNNNHSRIDLLVNNAGITFDGAFQLMNIDAAMRVLQVNQFGPLDLTIRLIPRLRRDANVEPMSSVVFLSSMAAVTGKEGQVPYSTSKGAILGMTRLLGSRLGRQGIRVNAIAPGFIETDMVRDLNPSFYEHVLEASAIPKIGDPEDVAELVGFLGSNTSKYLNSQMIRIDGGFLR